MVSVVGRWCALLGMNLLLGIPGVIPLWMLWYLTENWPLAELGITAREPTENDGMAVALLTFGPFLIAGALVWWFANRSLSRRISLASHEYWLCSGLVTILPSVAIMLWS